VYYLTEKRNINILYKENTTMVLPWIMDYNTMRLICTISEDLSYEAHEGGMLGYTKRYRPTGGEFVESFIPNEPLKWEDEKRWISDNFSNIVGRYEPEDGNLFKINSRGTLCSHSNGTDPDGARLDHMQRSQALMEAEDCAQVVVIDYCNYETPDRGLTIYKRLPQTGENTYYQNCEGGMWTDVPQPCHMQPRISGRKLSSYEELRAVGCPEKIIAKCQAGKWAAPKKPELQKFYVYPTA
jgi:hypothetical protein